jgi:hypothetical protein
MKIKALFLLFIFLLNTAVGLNCALRTCSDDCKNEIAEHHLSSALYSQQYHPSLTTVAEKDACCQDAVNNFATLAKLVPQSVKVFMPIEVPYIQGAYPYTFKLVPAPKADYQLLIDERQRPPTPDIRIVIQSFQV